MIWRSPYHSRIAQLADFITVLGGYLLSYLVWEVIYSLKPYYFPKPYELNFILFLRVIVFAALYVVLFNYYKAYSYQRFTSLTSEYKRIFKVSFISFMLSVFVNFMFLEREKERTIFLISFFIILFLLILEKTFLFFIAYRLRKQGKDRKKILIIGTGTRAKTFINIVNNNIGWGLDIIGMLTGEKEKIGQNLYSYKIIDHFNNIEKVLKELNPEEVIFTISTKRFDQFREVFEVCEREGVQIRLNSDFFGYLTKYVRVDNVYGLNIISFNTIHYNEFALLLKRILDITGSLIALILFSPFMLIAAVGILISDGRPIFYNWNVIGINKKPFKSWKFRTMVNGADKIKEQLQQQNEMQGPVFKIKNDPRIIPFGRWLRKWSIDETPQLISVLKGDMSLVGPRPAGPHELVKYESWQRRKLSIKPGITCLWQINGRNNINKFDDWVKLDLQYIDNWSLLLDIKILIKTIPSVIFGKGAS